MFPAAYPLDGHKPWGRKGIAWLWRQDLLNNISRRVRQLRHDIVPREDVYYPEDSDQAERHIAGDAAFVDAAPLLWWAVVHAEPPASPPRLEGNRARVRGENVLLAQPHGTWHTRMKYRRGERTQAAYRAYNRAVYDAPQCAQNEFLSCGTTHRPENPEHRAESGAQASTMMGERSKQATQRRNAPRVRTHGCDRGNRLATKAIRTQRPHEFARTALSEHRILQPGIQKFSPPDSEFSPWKSGVTVLQPANKWCNKLVSLEQSGTKVVQPGNSGATMVQPGNKW